MTTTLDKINRIASLRLRLYLVLSRRIMDADGWAGPATATNRLIASCTAQLEELWKERREERAGAAARIVEFWWGLPHGDVAQLSR